MNLSCLLGLHDDLGHYAPGHVAIRCQRCGRTTPGLRGPVLPVVPVVVTVRKIRKPRPALRVVKARRMA